MRQKRVVYPKDADIACEGTRDIFDALTTP